MRFCNSANLRSPPNHGSRGNKFDNDMIMKRLMILLLACVFREASIKVERIEISSEVDLLLGQKMYKNSDERYAELG